MADVSGIRKRSLTMTTCILIPAYNEARTIGDLVKRVKARGFDVFVVNDGSTDYTGDIACDAGAEVITSDLRKGKGATLKVGFAHILKLNRYEAIITMDGDAQHLPEDLPQFVDNVGNADLIIGNRMGSAKGKMPFVRYWTNKVMSWMISRACKRSIADTQSGYRLLRTDLLSRLDLSSDSFEIESEMITKTVKLKARILEVPIQVVYGEEESKINPFVDTIRFLKFLIKESK